MIEKASPPSSPARIVVTDARAMNPGDLDDAELRSLGDVRVFSDVGAGLIEACRDADVLVLNKSKIDAAVLAKLPHLRFIAVTATGCNTVDLAAAGHRGIPVSNVPDYSSGAVAQHVFALLLELNNRVAAHDAACKAGIWSELGQFSFTLKPIHELAGRRLGIIGYGSIGRRVAAIGRAFGMDVVAAERARNQGAGALKRASSDETDIRRLPLRELFATSDVLTLHCPLTETTQQIVNANSLSWMKPGAFLINTGRGALLDEVALAEALSSGRIAGAGLDVLNQEPPTKDHPLLRESRCVVTPHLGWASVEARQRLLNASIENVRAFLRGAPQNVVNLGELPPSNA